MLGVVDEVMAGAKTVKVMDAIAKVLTINAWSPPPHCPPCWRTLSFAFSFDSSFFSFSSNVQDEAANLAAAEQALWSR